MKIKNSEKEVTCCKHDFEKFVESSNCVSKSLCVCVCVFDRLKLSCTFRRIWLVYSNMLKVRFNPLILLVREINILKCSFEPLKLTLLIYVALSFSSHLTQIWKIWVSYLFKIWERVCTEWKYIFLELSFGILLDECVHLKFYFSLCTCGELSDIVSIVFFPFLVRLLF